MLHNLAFEQRCWTGDSSDTSACDAITHAVMHENDNTARSVTIDTAIQANHSAETKCDVSYTKTYRRSQVDVTLGMKRHEKP